MYSSAIDFLNYKPALCLQKHNIQWDKMFLMVALSYKFACVITQNLNKEQFEINL